MGVPVIRPKCRRFKKPRVSFVRPRSRDDLMSVVDFLQVTRTAGKMKTPSPRVTINLKDPSLEIRGDYAMDCVARICRRDTVHFRPKGELKLSKDEKKRIVDELFSE